MLLRIPVLNKFLFPFFLLGFDCNTSVKDRIDILEKGRTLLKMSSKQILMFESNQSFQRPIFNVSSHGINWAVSGKNGSKPAEKT